MNELVSVIMPVFYGRKHIQEAIISIQSQTYPNWELLAVHEYAADDGSAEIIRRAAAADPRVHLVMNQTRLGLAESLNRGIRLAKGPYIARMDADDISHPTRFEEQICYLNAHPHISLCGSWQHHFGPGRDWIHKAAAGPQACRANLLFFCDICHSTVMFRKKDFTDRRLFYDGHYLAEDFELWSRAVGSLQFANIPKVLGEYRWNGENRTAHRIQALAKEHACIVKRSLRDYLGLEAGGGRERLLEGWGNPFYAQRGCRARKKMYQDLEELLRSIYMKNQCVQFYEEKELLRVLNAKWRYAKYMEPVHEVWAAACIDDIFQKNRHPDCRLLWKEYLSRSVSIKTVLTQIMYFIRGFF